MKKILSIMFLVTILLLLGGTVSFGAFSVESKTVNSGESFSVSLTSSVAMDSYTVKLTSYEGLTFNSCSKAKSTSSETVDVTGGSIGYMNTDGTTTALGTYNFTAPTVTEDKTYKISFYVDNEETITSTITVKAPVVEEPKPTEEPKPAETAKPAETEKPATTTAPPANNENNTTKPETPAVVTKSSNANLKNLGIKPNDFTGFTPSKTSYSASVPNDVTEVEVYAYKAEDKQSISGTGKKTLAEGSNKLEVEVTAEDGTKKTYTINVVRLAKEETNNPDVDTNENVKDVALASLQIVSVKLNEAFSPDKFEYTATANVDAKEVIVNASANIEGAKVEVSAPEEFVPGENVIVITVKSADDKSEKVYKIKVNKDVEEESKKEELVQMVVGSIDDNNSNNTGSGSRISKETLIFCVGIGFITALGIAFAFIRYNKDKARNYTDEMIEDIEEVSTKEAIIDAAVAAGKLSSVSSAETANTTAGVARKGKHF